MGQRKLSIQEETILREIVKRAIDLPNDLFHYAEQIGRIRRLELGIPNRGGNGKTANKPRGFVDGHQVHATPRYGQAC